MTHAPQSIPANPGSCLKIQPNTYGQLKESALLITTALATIAIIGSVLAVLALNGVNLGALNSITAAIGEKYIYIALLSGVVLLLIDTVLIAALTNKYYNKQYTQKELDQSNLSHLRTFLPSIEPGQYRPLPQELFGKPTPLFGCIVKNYDGTVGVLAFKREEDYQKELLKLGFVDETNLEEFTPSYIEPQLIREHLNEFKRPKIDPGVCFKLDLVFYDGTTQVNVYALRLNRDGVVETHFFKNLAARNRVCGGFVQHTDIKNAILNQQSLVAYLPENSFWCPKHPISVREGGHPSGGNKPKHLFHVIFSQSSGTHEKNHEYFRNEDDATAYVAALKKQGFRDARALWEDPTLYPNDWIKDNFNLSRVSNLRLNENQFACINLQEEICVFALKIKDDLERPSVLLYFRTDRAREDYIRDQLAVYTDLLLLCNVIDNIIIFNALEQNLHAAGQNYWAGEVRLREKFHYILISRVNDNPELERHSFDTPEERNAFLANQGSWQPNDYFMENGRFKDEFIASAVNEVDLNKVKRQADKLSNGEHSYEKLYANQGSEIHCLAVKEKEGRVVIYYFASEEACKQSEPGRRIAQQQALQEACIQKAYKIQDKKFVNFALTSERDCWLERDVKIQYGIPGTRRKHTISINILYTLTNEEILISFPDNLQEALIGLNNVKATFLQSDVEYPNALGRELSTIGENDIRDAQEIMLPNEYCFWEQKRSKNTDFQCYTCLITNSDGVARLCFFNTKNAVVKAVKNLTNGFVRDDNIKRLAMTLAQVVHTNEASSANYVFTTPYEAVGKGLVITVSLDTDVVNFTYVAIDSMDTVARATGYINLNELVAQLENFPQPVINLLHKIGESTQRRYFGNHLRKPGLLKVQQYAIHKGSGYSLVMWVIDDKRSPCHCKFLPTLEAARKFAQDELSNFEEHIEA